MGGSPEERREREREQQEVERLTVTQQSFLASLVVCSVVLKQSLYIAPISSWNSHLRPGWPWTHRDLTAFASWVLGLKLFATLHNFFNKFFIWRDGPTNFYFELVPEASTSLAFYNQCCEISLGFVLFYNHLVSFFLFLFFFSSQRQGFLCSPGHPATHSVDQAGLCLPIAGIKVVGHSHLVS